MKNHSLLIFAWLFSVSSANADGIPCLDQSGAVKNANPAEVCKSILPKCSVLRDGMVKNLKELMEWKIWGYHYRKMDIDLEQSNLKNQTFVGPSLRFPICSVVGDKISGNLPGEITSKSLGSSESCGQFPGIEGVDAWTYKVTLRYNDDVKGGRWFSYVLGAYPWVIRRQAHEVIQQLAPDLSNLDSVLSSQEMTQDVKQTLNQIKDSVSRLSVAAKPLCEGMTNTSLIEDCKKNPSPFSISSPQMSVCNLVTAQMFLNEVATPGMLAYETLKRAQKMQKEKFYNIFNGTADPNFKRLIDTCSNNRGLASQVMSTIGSIFSLNFIARAIAARKAQSCVASCLFDGVTYHTFDNWNSGINNNGSQGNRKCSKQVRHNLSDGKPFQTILSSLISSEPYLVWFWDAILGSSYSESRQTDNLNFVEQNFGANLTNNNGFAGMIESIIRRDICPQQGNLKSGKNVCDDVAIGNKPAGAPL